MSIWIHREIGEPPSAHELNDTHCRFCKEPIFIQEIDDRWEYLKNKIEETHQKTILSMIEPHGEFILKELKIEKYPEEPPPTISICPSCGWWKIAKDIFISTKSQYWIIHFGSIASLKKFDHSDISSPAEEIKQFLAAKYENRFDIHPRKFEEVVASVFKSHNLLPELTNYSADGGIDIILRTPHNETIAVQVKRYKNSIKVSAIRELLGAMVINGYTRGAFVTTSTFQPGGFEIQKKLERTGLSLELIDGENFLKKLKASQIKSLHQYQDELEELILPSVNLEFCDEFHLNPL